VAAAGNFLSIADKGSPEHRDDAEDNAVLARKYREAQTILQTMAFDDYKFMPADFITEPLTTPTTPS